MKLAMKTDNLIDANLSALAKPELYEELSKSAHALICDETDSIANMANLAALIWSYVPNLNWAGFYRMADGELVLGPFIGKPACIRIPLDKGVCGAAARERQSQRVDDVHAFPGHIACDSASRSELVVPVMRNDTVLAVIDLDSPERARFDSGDQAGMEIFAARIAPYI